MYACIHRQNNVITLIYIILAAGLEPAILAETDFHTHYNFHCRLYFDSRSGSGLSLNLVIFII